MLNGALADYIPTTREYYTTFWTSFDIESANVIRITFARNSSGVHAVYLFDLSDSTKVSLIGGTEIEGISFSYANNKLTVTHTGNYAKRCLVERFG